MAHQALLMTPVPILVASVLGSTVSGAGVTSISIPATAAGDLIIAFGSNRTSTASPTPAGWTSIATGIANPFGTGSDRSTRMVYQFTDGGAQTLTFDGGTGDSSSTDPYSGCLIFRGASEVGVGAGVTTTATGTTLAIPTLTVNRVPATVVAFSFYDAITAAPAGWTVTNGMAYAEYLSAWAGGNFTLGATAAEIGTVVEIY